MNILEIKNVKKSFNDSTLHVLKDISLTVAQGEVVAIIGPSGSGKSTLLRSLNLLEEPTGGQIFFDGVDLADKSVDINLHRQKMGMVFQHFNLFPHKTVLQNITRADDGHHFPLRDVQVTVVQRLHGAMVVLLHQVLHGDQLIACRHDASSFQWLRWPWRPGS